MAEINVNRIKLSQLRALVAIARTGTFSDAASQLDLSQSAVSHAIATLEEELGVSLLSRGRQGAVLTPVGQQITNEAMTMLSHLKIIGRKAQDAKGLQAGLVRVVGFRSVATHVLPVIIEEFRRLYPGISVSIGEGNDVRGAEEILRRGEADIGFTYLPVSEAFDAWELFRDDYVALLPKAKAPVTKQPLDWETLNELPLILPMPEDGCRYNVDQYLLRHGQTITPAYEVKEDSTVVSMVRRGLGATIIARLAAEPIPKDVTVCELPVPLQRVIGVITLADALQTPPVFAFLDTLKSTWKQKSNLVPSLKR
ncbi:LysR substrate binding domain protein [Synechococcus sp. PCC 7335]|nr:LysR family transcriptional regulator [Synechococcus sp. PCC 7335]EDX84524.1 LysR substrate binding domain protein [Synechococcus sp. PCC 7335]